MLLVKILLIIAIPALLVLPFLPFRKPFFFSRHAYPRVGRKATVRNIAILAVLTLVFAILMPLIHNLAVWFGDLGPISWLLGKLPAYAAYSADLAIILFVNFLYIFAAFFLLHLVSSGEFLFKKIFGFFKKLKNRKKPQQKATQKSSAPTDPAHPTQPMPKELLPEPEEPLPDGRVILPGSDVAAPARKAAPIAAKKPADEPERKGLSLLWHQLRGLFFEDPADSNFVRPQVHHLAKHLRNFLLLLGALYLMVFLLLLIPVFFRATSLEDFLYVPLRFFLAVNYLYPVLSLVALTLLFHLINAPCAPIEPTQTPELVKLRRQGKIIDLDALESTLMKTCGKDYDVYSFFSDDTDVHNPDRIVVDLESDPLMKSVADYIAGEGMAVNQDYLFSVRHFFDGDDVLFHAPLHSAVGPYLYVSLNMRIMQGDRIVVICQNRSQIDHCIEQLNQGLMRVTRTHKPIWRIVDRNHISPSATEDVLVLCPEDFLDERLFAAAKRFFSQVTVALLPDADQLVTTNNYSCEIIAQKLQQYASAAVQYLFLANYTLLNLESALMDRFLRERAPRYCRGDYAYGDNHIFVWRGKETGPVLLDNATRNMALETMIANIANNFGITNPNVISRNVIYSNQINPEWLDIYDSSRRPLGFAIVADDNFNLPGVIYSYSRYIGKKASILHIISRQYLLRDYFFAHAPQYLVEQPLMERSHVAKQSEQTRAQLHLLGQLMMGLPVEEFVAEMNRLGFECPNALTYSEIACLHSKLLKKILGEVPLSTNQEHFTLYRPSDEFYPRLHIRISEESELLPYLLKDSEFVQLHFSRGLRKPVFINLYRSMIDQKYVVGQYLVYENECFMITKVDRENGIITVTNATSTYGYSIDSVQLRHYTLLEPAVIRDCQNVGVKEFLLNPSIASKTIVGKNISSTGLYMVYSPDGFRISSETQGYYLINTAGNRLQVTDGGIHRIDISAQEQLPLKREVHGALYLRLDLKQSQDDRLTMSLAALLQETMKTIFPDRYFCLSVCPILKNPDKIYKTDGASGMIANLYPTLAGWDQTCEKSIELMIVDDCVGGCGALDLLFDRQGTYMTNLLWMLSDYLDWQYEEESLPYLYFGMQTQPSIFDFDALRAILKTYANEYERESQLQKQASPITRCALCSKPIVKPYLWHNTLGICHECGEDYAPTEEEAQLILNYAKDYLVDTFSITLPELTVKIDPPACCDQFSAIDLEAGIIYLTDELPLLAMHMQIMRQIVRIWQLLNLDIAGDCIVDGQILLVGLQYLRYLQQFRHAHLLHRDYLKAETPEAKGYCTLQQMLQTEDHDNSFYLLANHLFKTSRPPIKKTTKKTSTRDTATPAKARYLRERLPEAEKQAYDRILTAIMNMEEKIDLTDLDIATDRIFDLAATVIFDHPEIHWVKRNGFVFDDENCKMLKIIYTMTADERRRRQNEIDAHIQPFVAEITPEMGDYEVALKLYEKVIGMLDYDTITLREQEKDPLKAEDTDDLRNIYGAIVQHKAVCAGYAMAYQYLLQRFGIEAIYVLGSCGKEGRHAWNIVKLEGDYYHIDATWGDRSNTDPTRNGKGMSYAYFALTDELIRRSRSIDAEPSMPPCTADSCNYFVREGLHFTKYDPGVLKNIIAEYFKNEEHRFIELRFENLTLLRQATDSLCKNGGIFEALRSIGKDHPTLSYIADEELYLLKINLD